MLKVANIRLFLLTPIASKRNLFVKLSNKTLLKNSFDTKRKYHTTEVRNGKIHISAQRHRNNNG